jgi:RNA polymerase subunit RPABC4/transcription elongation factor Spt4
MNPADLFDALEPLVLYLTAAFGAFLAALWLSLVFWTWRDIRRRSHDRLVRVLAPLVVLLLSLPGLVVYLILRPPQTIEEEYQDTLEEEALLSDIEEQPFCPGCGRRVQAEWQLCPHCHTRLRKPCGRCGRLLELPWNICPYCGQAAQTQAASERAELSAG